MPQLGLKLLGGFDLTRAGTPLLPVESPRLRALLAYLALEPRPHSRARLAALLWPDAPGHAARRNLRFVLLKLRRHLGDDSSPSPALIATRETLALDPGAIAVDASALAAASLRCSRCSDVLCSRCAQRHAHTAATYGGDLLADLTLTGADELASWLADRREALRRQMLTLIEQLIAFHEASGDRAQALFWTQRGVDISPWDESLQRRLMKLLAQTGHPSAAASQFVALRARLENQLGVAPEADTEALYRHIRATFTPNADAAPSRRAPDRRQLTVLAGELFADRDADPEDVATEIDRVRELCIAQITDAGGHAEVRAAGFCGYFGYPEAREDAAHQAMRTGLQIAAEVASQPSILVLRLAAHAGVTVTGGGAGKADAAGQISAAAASLCSQAQPGQLWATEDAWRLCATRFRGKAHALFGARGFSRMVRVIAEMPSPGAASPTPLVGRTREQAQLFALWERAKAGIEANILLRGDPGIGKSRLAAAVAARTQTDDARVTILRCEPHTIHTPYSAFLQLARERPAIQRCLDELWAAGAKPRTAQRHALLDAAFSVSDPRPALIVIEDLHWADPSTIDLVALAVATNRQSARLLMLTARPEFLPPWNPEQVPELWLHALLPDAAAALSRHLAGPSLTAADHRRIVATADGVPLFIEELTRTVADGDTIPATLRDLLLARLDRLGPAKRVAQIAAAFGREIDHATLVACAPMAEENVQRGIRRLLDAGLLTERPATDGAEPRYDLRHALIREAAYHALTRGDRQAAHARIAEVLTERSPEVASAHPEWLAQHLEAAGDIRAAIDAWAGAAQQSTKCGANLEAVAQLRAALALCATLEPSPKRDALELKLQVAIGAPLASTRGYGASETIDAFERALTLARRTPADDVDPMSFDALWGVWLTASSRKGYGVTLELATELCARAQRQPDRCRQILAWYAMGNACFWRARFADARKHFELAIGVKLDDAHEKLVERYAEDVRVNALAMLGWTFHFLDQPEKAYARCDDALALAAQTDHPYSRVTAKVGLNALTRFARDTERCLRVAGEVLTESREHGFALWEAGGLATGGWARALEGDETGVADIERSLTIVRAAMVGVETFYLAMLAEALLAVGQSARALTVIDETLAIAAKVEERYYEAELLRLREKAAALA